MKGRDVVNDAICEPRSGIYVGRVDFKLKGGQVIASAGRLLDLRDETLA